MGCPFPTFIINDIEASIVTIKWTSESLNQFLLDQSFEQSSQTV